ncbi:MAG: hypothetical protein ACI86M_001619 [Saprospiraceae bacterium]|jgi:hypothetical protein
MNFCYVNPDGGPLEVKITVDNGARSNWNCAHANKEDDKWKALETFKLKSGDEGTDEHTLATDLKSIDDTSLLWRVAACGTVQGAERAKFTIVICQDGKEIYDKVSDRQVPACKDNKAVQFRNMVAFKLHSDNDKKADIWDVLS